MSQARANKSTYIKIYTRRVSLLSLSFICAHGLRINDLGQNGQKTEVEPANLTGLQRSDILFYTLREVETSQLTC